MNIRIVLTSIATLLTLIIFQRNALADLSDEAINGRVRSASGEQVQICLDRGTATSVGQQLDVIRHRVHTLPKGATTLASEHAGIIRIVSVDADRCASATVVSGSAQALDWVAARATP